MYPKAIQKLIEALSRFPTVGPRTAGRFVFYLLKAPDQEIEELAQAIRNLKKEIKLCGFCFNPYQATEDENKSGLCGICRDQSRDHAIICVVEKESDLEALERTKNYKGLYFILGEAMNMLKKDGIKELRRKELEERLESPEKFGLSGVKFQEVIIATNPTTEGEATALYVERFLAQMGVKTTRLARGLPVGGELEYADEETLRSALEGRR